MSAAFVIVTAVFIPCLLSNLILGKWAGKADNCCRWVRVLTFSVLQWFLIITMLLIGAKTFMM